MTFENLEKEIRGQIDKIIEQQDWVKPNYNVLPTRVHFGDAFCNVAFQLAKQLKTDPNAIAIIIAERYTIQPKDLVERIEPAEKSGFLNFFVKLERYGKDVITQSKSDDYGSIDKSDIKQIIVEHTSVNPNKAIHIGHVRNIIIGDCIARLLSNANNDVKILNYIDDSGLQVADIIVGFKHLGFPENPPSAQKFDQYCGDEVYVKTSEKYDKQPELQEIRKNVIKEIENPESEISKFADKITKKVLASQLTTCWKLGATYDCLNFESQIIHSGLWEEIFEKLKEMKIIELSKNEKNSGCWVIPVGGDEDEKVIVRSDGTATYIAKDIPYAAWKLGALKDPFNYKKYPLQQKERILWQTTLEDTSEPKQNFFANKVYTVIDSRQSRLQKIVTELMMKFTSNQNSYEHLAYESVTLSSDTAKQLGMDTGGKQAQMSGRKGLYVNADSVIGLLIDKIKEETKKRNPKFTSEQISQIADDVAIGTIRYEMIKQDLDKIITFDLNKSLSLEGDTASYIQYAYARACRILENGKNEKNLSSPFESSYDLLREPPEKELIKYIGLFRKYVNDATENISPKVIAKYCYFLVVSFNSFYERVRVLDDSKGIELIKTRLSLVESFKLTLGKAMNLLGIPSPERM